MYLNVSMLIHAVLLVLGVLLCMAILRRWREDLERLREPADQADRPVVIIMWSIAVVVAFLCIRFGINIGTSIVAGIRSLLH